MPNGNVFVLPMQFSVPVLMGTTEALAHAQSLNALVTAVETGNPAIVEMQGLFAGVPADLRPAMHFNNLEELYNMLWLANAPALISDNQLNNDALREFLRVTKSISDKYELTAQDQGMHGFTMMVGGRGGRGNIMTGSVMRFMMGAADYGTFSLDNLTLLQIFMERESEIVPFPGLAQGVWIPSAMVGISSDTNVPDFAAALVNAMMSVQVQQINYGNGLPVTRAGMTAQIDETSNRLEEMGISLFEFKYDIDGFVANLQTPSLIEVELREMIWRTVENLCNDRLDLDGAVREIEQNIRNFLAERQ